MSKEELKKLILNDPKFSDFVSGTQGAITITISNVPVVIFKENIGVDYYYQLPDNKDYNYSNVVDFLKIAIPVISELVENERTIRLNK